MNYIFRNVPFPKMLKANYNPFFKHGNLGEKLKCICLPLLSPMYSSEIPF